MNEDLNPGMSDTWIAYIADADGFVFSDPMEVLRTWEAGHDALHAFEAKHDSTIERIVVATGEAKPVPQYEGSDVLREPALVSATERIVFEVHDLGSGDYEQVALFWRVAQATALAFNEEAQFQTYVDAHPGEVEPTFRNAETYHEPYGWGPTRVPSLAVLTNMVNMVSVDLPPEAVHWDDETKIFVANWATQEHLEASDNEIPDEERFTKPEVLG